MVPTYELDKERKADVSYALIFSDRGAAASQVAMSSSTGFRRHTTQILLSMMIKLTYNEVKATVYNCNMLPTMGHDQGNIQKQISSSLKPLKPRVVEHQGGRLHWEPAPP